MEKEQRAMKKPIPKETIFKLMLYVTFIVAAAFLVKNIVTRSLQGSLIIGISLTIFAVIVILMKKMNAQMEKQQFVVSMSVVPIIVMIFLFIWRLLVSQACICVRNIQKSRSFWQILC